MNRRAIGAGAVYFLAVFAAGFVIGAIRVLWVAPRTGALAAVALELPVMLAIAWVVTGLLLPRFLPGAGLAERATMGLVAFSLLLPAEIALGVWGFGQSLAMVMGGFATAPGALGLFGQVLFAAIPAIRPL